jgi:DNA-directed RNA polymerase subunit beta'
LAELDREYKQKFKNLKDERSQDALKDAMLGVKKNLEELRVGMVLDEVTYHRLSLKYSTLFEAEIGAEALYNICAKADLPAMMKQIEGELEEASKLERVKIQKRYNLIRSMNRAGVRPEWMFLTVLPVIPPDLRPMVALDGGRHATSDVNDLYRRVINRNNRLKKLKELEAPEVILRNEKRILQEAIDALLDNSMRRTGGVGAMSQAQRRPLKSLSDNLRGKQGRFRQNLLGKRVDYSGRSVIVVGPELQLSQCGLPKHMALELFRPFVIAKILQSELAYNIRGAGRLIDDRSPEVWAILEDVIKDKHVLLNRAPTLHRLSIQAFRPILIEGDAIQVHPLVCSAFNADFDGDQMAVHVPLSTRAQEECARLMSADRNILKPGNGNPVANMKLDIVLGCFWVTQYEPGVLGEGKVFSSINDVVTAHDFGAVDLRAKIKMLADSPAKYGESAGQLIETSVGRLLFNAILPADYPFINKEIGGKEINSLLESMIDRYGINEMGAILDRIKNFGFRYATHSGTTWGINDVQVPKGKKDIIAAAQEQVNRLNDEYNEGLLSKDERYNLTIKAWTAAKTRIEKVLFEEMDKTSSVAVMLNSGARGSLTQVSQMSGMKGLILNPAGRPIDFPIIPSYKEGLSPLEYFISTHGSRKTLTDTALNTAKAGYLTRRLVYVAEDVIVSIPDCGDTEGKRLSVSQLSGFDRSIAKLIWGRVIMKDIKNVDGKTLFKKGHLLSAADAKLVEDNKIDEVWVRTPFTCKATHGVCQACYGVDLGRGAPVILGEPVGIVAAQAIGEPGTQLTMRTKHSGGVDVGGDIVGGLPRVEEIFERRYPKNAAVLAPANALVTELKTVNNEVTIVLRVEGKTGKNALELVVPRGRDILVKAGDEVVKGQFLSEGPADLQELFKYAGKHATEEYIINEINKIYELQGAAISRKHLEIIIRQMFSRQRIKRSGDANFDVGEIVETAELALINAELEKKGAEPAVGEEVILGISEVSLTTSSFIAAASFAQATRVLTRAAVRGVLDRLNGLKENVIIGRLIPAGTGWQVPKIAEPAPAPVEEK